MMRKFIRIVLMMAVAAMTVVSCNKKPDNQPVEKENGFSYAGETSPVGFGKVVDEKWEGLYDDWHITLAIRPLYEGNAYPRVLIQVPKARAGELIDLNIKQDETLDDYWYISIMPNYEDWFSGDERTPLGEHSAFVGGHLKYTWDGTKLLVDCKVELANGETFEVYYDGELPELEKPAMPEYDETLNNEWQFNDGEKVAINWAAFEKANAPYTGSLFYLSDAAPVGTTPPINLLMTYSSLAKLGTEIILEEDNSGDPWGLEFGLNRQIDAFYMGWGNDLNNFGTGKMILTRDGTTITVKLAVAFMDKKILRAKFSGEATEL